MILFLLFGIPTIGWLYFRNGNSSVSSRIQGEPVIDLTPHLTEFSRLIKDGYHPSRWLVSGAIEEACEMGDWPLVRAISRNYTFEDAPLEDVGESSEESKELPKEESKRLEFSIERTSSPIEGIGDDDWRMFVNASRVESEDFDSEHSTGMFRQNKKRLAKLGISDTKDPISQYSAFEKEVSQMVGESKEIINKHVAMPVNINGEDIPVTLSGLISVMRIAGSKNAEKWLESEDERKKFPNTTEAFKRSNGCF